MYRKNVLQNVMKITSILSTCLLMTVSCSTAFNDKSQTTQTSIEKPVKGKITLNASNPNLVISIKSPEITRAIITKTYEVTRLDIIISNTDTKEVLAETTWAIVEGDSYLNVELSEPGNYTVSVTHTGVNGNDTVTRTETKDFSIISGFITTLQIIPGGFATAQVIEAREDGLVLYATSVTKPVFGLSGTIINDNFTTGKEGGAYQVTAGNNNGITFPKEVVTSDKGTIEFWAKLEGVADSDAILTLGNPAFLIAGDSEGSNYSLMINGNDGWGGAGLCGWGGNGNVASGEYTNSYSYGEVLGDVTAWHHFALVWNIDGVDGTNETVQIYKDGNPVGSSLICNETNHTATKLDALVDGELSIGQISSAFTGSFLIDELKVWNYAKTEFGFTPVEYPVKNYTIEASEYGESINSIQLNENDTLTLILKSNPTTGYSWVFENLNYESTLELISSDYVGDLVPEEICGAGGKQILVFKAIKQGVSDINIIYVRPWENISEIAPIGKCFVNVLVGFNEIMKPLEVPVAKE